MMTEKVEFEYVYGNQPTEELVSTLAIEETVNFELEYSVGKKQYELSNHLGNVLAVISDWKLPVISGASVVSYNTVVVSSQDYSPFGVTLSGRSWSEGYRYGFQNQETDDEMWGGAISFKYRIEDARLGRFFSVDPMICTFPFYATYAFSGNRVIDAIEMLGLQPELATRRRSARVSRNFSGTSFFQRIFGIQYSGKYFKNNEYGGKAKVKVVSGDIVALRPTEPSISHIIPREGVLPLLTEKQIILSVRPTLVPEPTKEVENSSSKNENSEDEVEDNSNIPKQPVPPLDIRFEGNSDQLINKEQAKRQLSAIANYMKENPTSNITIIGNTGGDPNVPEGSGSNTLKAPVYNSKLPTIRDLMLGRARTIRKLLIEEYGINPNRIWVAPGRHDHNENNRKSTVIER